MDVQGCYIKVEVKLTELVFLAHGIDKVAWGETPVKGTGELLRSTVEGTTEAGADGEQTRDKGGDEVLASTGGDDGVHGAGDSGTVIGSEHEDHLEELGGVGGQTTTEPEQRHDTTDADVLLEDVGDGHAGVEQLLATVVRDGGDEGGGLSDETELLGPGVVEGDLGHDGLWLGLDGALLDELLVDGSEHIGEVLEGIGDVDAGLAHGLVLGDGGLEV